MNEPKPRFSGTPVPTPPIPDDDGAVSAELAAQLDAFAAGNATADQVLGDLSRSRLFVPVIAILDESEVGANGLRHEKQSSMATVLVQSPDGGRALLGFSCIDSLTLWRTKARTKARPVPLAAPLAARAAVDEGAETLLIDVAGPVPFALTGAELLLVAAVSRSPGEPCDDPVLIAALRRLISAEGRVVSATLDPATLDPATLDPATLDPATLDPATLDPASEHPIGAYPAAAVGASDVARAPAVVTLGIEGADRSWLGALAEQIASDRVVARLLPEGLRIKDIPAADMTDTPGVVLV